MWQPIDDFLRDQDRRRTRLDRREVVNPPEWRQALKDRMADPGRRPEDDPRETEET